MPTRPRAPRARSPEQPAHPGVTHRPGESATFAPSMGATARYTASSVDEAAGTARPPREERRGEDGGSDQQEPDQAPSLATGVGARTAEAARAPTPLSRSPTRRASARRLSCSSRQAGQPSRWARRPGIAASASRAGELELDVAVELVEALVAADLRRGRAEQPPSACSSRSLHHVPSGGRVRGRAREMRAQLARARRAASCRARRASCRAARRARRSGRRSSASATRTRRWCGVSTSSIAALQRAEQLALLGLVARARAAAREQRPSSRARAAPRAPARRACAASPPPRAARTCRPRS